MRKKYVFGAIMLTLLMVLNLGVKIKSMSVTSRLGYATEDHVYRRDVKCIVCSNGIKLECIEGGKGSCTPITVCTSGTCGVS